MPQKLTELEKIEAKLQDIIRDRVREVDEAARIAKKSLSSDMEIAIADLMDIHKPCCGEPPACDSCRLADNEGYCETYRYLTSMTYTKMSTYVR